MQDNFSIANPHPERTDAVQKLGLAIGGIGLLLLLITWISDRNYGGAWSHLIVFGTIIIGTCIYALRTYLNAPPGIKNNGTFHRSLTNRGLYGWILGVVLTGFYVCLYWFPETLGLHSDSPNTGLVAMFDPLSQALKSQPASQWFVYGSLYTLAHFGFGFQIYVEVSPQPLPPDADGRSCHFPIIFSLSHSRNYGGFKSRASLLRQGYKIFLAPQLLFF